MPMPRRVAAVLFVLAATAVRAVVVDRGDPPSEGQEDPEARNLAATKEKLLRKLKEREEGALERAQKAAEKKASQQRERERQEKVGEEKQRWLQEQKALSAKRQAEREAIAKDLADRRAAKEKETAQMEKSRHDRLREKETRRIQEELTRNTEAQWQEAKSAAVVLGQDDPLHVTAGEASQEAMSLVEAMKAAVGDKELVGGVTVLSEKLGRAMTSHIYDTQARFQQYMSETAKNSAEPQRLGVLATGVVADILNLAEVHHKEVGKLGVELGKLVPKNVTRGLVSVLAVLKPLLSPLRLDAVEFNSTNSSMMCGQLADFMSRIQPHHDGFQRARAVLNATAASVPILTSLAGRADSPEVQAVASGIVSLGFMRAIALENTTYGALAEVESRAADQLGCKSHAGTARLSFSFAWAALAALLSLSWAVV